jgi:hypothetical protein
LAQAEDEPLSQVGDEHLPDAVIVALAHRHEEIGIVGSFFMLAGGSCQLRGNRAIVNWVSS